MTRQSSFRRAKFKIHSVNEARPRERSDRGRSLPYGKKASYTGVRTGSHYLISLSVGLSVSVCVTFVVFTGCESCTRPISTNPGSMKAGEYGLTRETCFAARRLKVVAVAGLLWISLCILGAAGSRVFLSPVFFLRTHMACCKYEAVLPYLPLC